MDVCEIGEKAGAAGDGSVGESDGGDSRGFHCFNSQGVANTLWAYARMEMKPGVRVMELLERRAEVILGEFNASEIAQMRCWYNFSSRPSEVWQQALRGLDSTGKRKR